MQINEQGSRMDYVRCIGMDAKEVKSQIQSPPLLPRQEFFTSCIAIVTLQVYVKRV